MARRKRERSGLWGNFKIGDTVHFRTTQKKGKHAGKALDGVVQSKGPQRASVRLGHDPRKDCWTVPYVHLTLVERPQPLRSDQIIDAEPFCKPEEDQVPSTIPPDAVPLLAGDRAYIDRGWDNAGKLSGTILRKSKKTITFLPDLPYREKRAPIKVFAYELRPILKTPLWNPQKGWDDDPLALERIAC